MPSHRLVELYAHRVGVIADARVTLSPGFTAITGETGAGKTLLLGALSLCLGGDGPTGREDGLRAVAVFERSDGSEVALARESSGGRLRASVDGVPSSAEALRLLARDLVVVHGQHDSLRLRQRAAVLEVIDRFGQVEVGELEMTRRRRREVDEERAMLGGDAASRLREVDLLDFQLSEIAEARLTGPEELDEVLAELTRLTELADAQADLSNVLEELEGDGADGLLGRLAQIQARIPRGEATAAPAGVMRDALAAWREAVADLASLADPEALDRARMAELEARAGLLRDLARKHGGSLEAVLRREQEMSARRGALAAAESRLQELDSEAVSLDAREGSLAAAVREARDEAAQRLSAAVAVHLPRVALAGARLRFEVGGEDGSHARVVFAANPGQPEGPLDEAASGGELSRVLLAISLETLDADQVVVFDEIDAGVGGETAQQIGECLAELGRRQQVLAVTHLASVAARADHHLLIDKELRDGVTTTRLRVLEGEERVAEVARMLAGARAADQSLALAAAMIEGS